MQVLTKLVAQKPKKTVYEMIMDVMLGKDEDVGSGCEEESTKEYKGLFSFSSY